MLSVVTAFYRILLPFYFTTFCLSQTFCSTLWNKRITTSLGLSINLFSDRYVTYATELDPNPRIRAKVLKITRIKLKIDKRNLLKRYETKTFIIYSKVKEALEHVYSLRILRVNSKVKILEARNDWSREKKGKNDHNTRSLEIIVTVYSHRYDQYFISNTC